MAARQCVRTHGAVAEVYHAPSKVCIAIRMGLLYVILGKEFMVYPCENALDRDLNLFSGNMISVLLLRHFFSLHGILVYKQDDCLLLSA